MDRILFGIAIFLIFAGFIISLAFFIGQEGHPIQNITDTLTGKNITISQDYNITPVCYMGTPGLISAKRNCESMNCSIVRTEDNVLYNITVSCGPDEQGIFCVCGGT